MSESDFTELWWCVGRFAYLRGGAKPIHFMEMHDFQLDDAIALSMVLSLRAQRELRDLPTIVDERLQAMMRDAIEQVVADMILATARNIGQPLKVLEFYPGVGVLFEFVKSKLDGSQDKPSIEYLGVGERAFRTKFNVLHSSDDCLSRYELEDKHCEPSALALLISEADLVIYNHAEAVMHRSPQAISLDAVGAARPRRLIVSSPVTGSQERAPAWTLKLREVELPSSTALCRTLARTAGEGACRFFPGRGADLFINGSALSVGHFLALCGEFDYRLLGPDAQPIES